MSAFSPSTPNSVTGEALTLARECGLSEPEIAAAAKTASAINQFIAKILPLHCCANAVAIDRQVEVYKVAIALLLKVVDGTVDAPGRE
jgi:hypothetical protein